jgi:hypothetical protein
MSDVFRSEVSAGRRNRLPHPGLKPVALKAR